MRLRTGIEQSLTTVGMGILGLNGNWRIAAGQAELLISH
jgi:hypothetical protein